RRFANHMTSAAALATERYSASVDDRATVLCLFDSNNTGLPPK
ncbi:hypothetical protein A2U01_0091079, partial [Trifolium medium]|nr:hypothetical protein [Trifolium medium]